MNYDKCPFTPGPKVEANWTFKVGCLPGLWLTLYPFFGVDLQVGTLNGTLKPVIFQ